MIDADREWLARCLYLGRYVGHAFRDVSLPTLESERRREQALRLARLVGVRAEYVRYLIAHPVLSITVEEFE